MSIYYVIAHYIILCCTVPAGCRSRLLQLLRQHGLQRPQDEAQPGGVRLKRYRCYIICVYMYVCVHLCMCIYIYI